MKTKLSLLLIYHLLFITYNSSLRAQNIGINGTGANAHSSALLDVDDAGTNTKGLLIPRIPLTAINVATPVTSPATSLLVYNTASASTGTNAITPGYYYWDGLKWVRFAYSASGSSANDWNILGNAGTVAGTNFLGTTDNVDLVFKRNNFQSGLISSSNTSFGLQALNPTAVGGLNSAFGYLALAANTTGSLNVALGQSSLYSNTIGEYNTATGRASMYYNIMGNNNVANGGASLFSNTSGSNNVAIGHYALNLNITGNNNVATGFGALQANTASENTALGYNALKLNTTGNLNVAVGSEALTNNVVGIANTAVGYHALLNNIASGLTAFGNDALRNNTTGIVNTAVGNSALLSNITGSENSAFGSSALQANNGSGNTANGYVALVSNTTGTDNSAFGRQALRVNAVGSRNTSMGAYSLFYNIASNNVSVGSSASFSNTTGSDNTTIGYSSLYSNTTGSLNVAVGSQAGFNNTTGNVNTFIGSLSGFGTTTSGGNTAVGYLSLNGANNGSGLNSALGFRSLQNNTTGTENLGTGYASLFQNTTGLNNTATGAGAMRDNTTGNNNTAVGRAALSLNLVGSNNTVIGQRAGATNSAVTTHNNNTFIGAETDATINNLTNATAIGYNAKVGQSNALILGGTGADAVNVGIGTSTPRSLAQIEGPNAELQISNNALNTGTLAIYFAHQQSAYGASGYTKGGAAIFTKSAGSWAQAHMYFALRNANDGADVTMADTRMTILNSGNIGIGTTAPTEKLEVQGSVKIVDGTQGAGRVLVSDATGKASWKEAAVNTNKLSYSATFPATVTVTAPGSLITLGPAFTVATTGIYRVLVDATIPQGMILGIDNQSLSNAILYSTVSNRYYAQYFVYVTAGTHNLILYNDANSALTDGGPYWYFVIEGPIN